MARRWFALIDEKTLRFLEPQIVPMFGVIALAIGWTLCCLIAAGWAPAAALLPLAMGRFLALRGRPVLVRAYIAQQTPRVFLWRPSHNAWPRRTS